jgi:hypothetical protein
MGMDLHGKNPTTEEGEYFRNNIWSWGPLADYIRRSVNAPNRGLRARDRACQRGCPEKVGASICSSSGPLLTAVRLSGTLRRYQRPSLAPSSDCRACCLRAVVSSPGGDGGRQSTEDLTQLALSNSHPGEPHHRRRFVVLTVDLRVR